MDAEDAKAELHEERMARPRETAREEGRELKELRDRVRQLETVVLKLIEAVQTYGDYERNRKASQAKELMTT